MENKTISLNNKYDIKILKNESHRLYTLIERENDKRVAESFNKDSFILKAKKIVNITKVIENLVASY